MATIWNGDHEVALTTCFNVSFYSIGGMAILYVLEIKDDDFSNDNSGQIVGLVDTITSSVGLDGWNNFTTKEPSLSNLTSRTTLQPRKTKTYPLRLSDVVSPTNKSSIQHSTAKKSSPVTAVSPLSPKFTPKVNGKFSCSLFRVAMFTILSNSS